MKATELRIGNLVMAPRYRDETQRLYETSVESIDYRYAETKDGAWCMNHLINYCEPETGGSHRIIISEDIEPVPLTEEWLLKFGFVKLPTGEFKITHPNDMFDYILDELGGEWHTAIDQDQEGLEWYAFSWGIKYVHQLQNLYFALTGNELTISE